MVTGLKGIGDFECAETLRTKDPAFKIHYQDAQNWAAGKALGLRGAASDWTWENWMSIEIQRGLSPKCYACLLADDYALPVSNGAAINANDPRLIIGMLFGNALEDYVLRSLGSRSTSTFHEGIYWRVAAAFLYPRETLNAPETLEAVTWLVGEWSGHDMNGDGQFSRISLDKVLQTFEVKGGYVAMTGNEAELDQRFQAVAVIQLFLENAGPGLFQTAADNFYYGILNDCRDSKGSEPTIGHCVAQRLNDQ